MRIAITDFAGGQTDNYIDGPANAGKKMNNVVIDQNGHMVQRDGITILNSSAPQLPTGNQKVDAVYYFDSTTFAKSGTKLYYLEEGDTSWTHLQGPSSHDAFPDSELGAPVTWSEWRGHLFMTPGPGSTIKSGCNTQKVYRNASGDWTLVQAGMPDARKALQGGIYSGPTVTTGEPQYLHTWYVMFVRQYVAQVNGVNTVFRDYGAPDVVQDEGNEITAIDSVTLGTYTIATLSTENYRTSDMQVWTYRTKLNSPRAYLTVIAALAGTITDSEDDRDIIGMSFIMYATSDTSRASGKYRFSSTDICNFYVNQVVTLADNNSSSLNYYYVIAVDYSTCDVTFSATRGGSAFDGTNYTVSQQMRAYVFMGEELPPGISDGVFNEPAPKSYFSGISSDGCGWYFGAADGVNGLIRPNRVLQSRPGDPDAVPGGNYCDVPGDIITARGFAGQHPVSFIRNRHYRIEGRFDAVGGGGLRAVLISKTDGAISPNVAETGNGIFFASENGFCYTDGFKSINITQLHLRETYKDLSSKSRISACYDAQNNRVYFGVESSELDSGNTGKNNALFILDVTRMEQGKPCFTTASSVGNLQPNSLHYDSANARVLIGDQRGYIFKFDPDTTTDPIVDTATSYSSWGKAAIVWEWITCAFSFGAPDMAKWLGNFKVIAKNMTGNLSIDFTGYKDDRSTGIRIKSVRDWSISEGLHKISRMWAKGLLHCHLIQLKLAKAYTIIYQSDDYAAATCSGVSNTAQLNVSWPTHGGINLVGHYFYPYMNGGYETGFQITAQSSDTLTVADPGGTFPTGSLAWIIKGYPKAETLKLHSLTLNASEMEEGFPERSDQGGNV